MEGIVWKAVAQGGIVRGNCPGRYQFGVNCPRRNCPRAVCHVDDYHTRNGIAHLNVLCCRRTKSDISRIWSTYKAVIILFYTQILVHPDWDSNCHINRTLGIIHIYVRKTFRKTNISEKFVHVPNKWAPPPFLLVNYCWLPTLFCVTFQLHFLVCFYVPKGLS